MDQDAYDDLLQRLTALVIKLDSPYDKLMDFVDEQRQFNLHMAGLLQEQRAFNAQQVAINQRLETLLERARRSASPTSSAACCTGSGARCA